MAEIEHIQIKDFMEINGIQRFVYAIILHSGKVLAKCAYLTDKPGVAGNCEVLEITA